MVIKMTEENKYKIETAPIFFYKDCSIDITEDLENCAYAIQKCETEYKISIFFAFLFCFGGGLASIYFIFTWLSLLS